MSTVFFQVTKAVTVSFFVTLFIIPLLTHFAHSIQFVDVPDGNIKQQRRAIPYLGGIGIFLGFMTGITFILPHVYNLTLFFCGLVLLLLIGLLDDWAILAPWQKIVGQCMAITCFLSGGFYLKYHLLENPVTIPLSIFWMLCIINAFNLVDVMDGLATTIGIMACVGFFAVSLLLDNPLALILISSFAGALCGFLYYNKPQATIYLGDSGALFIGGFMATIPFFINWGTYTPFGLFAPPVILAIPCLELLGLICIRLYKGIPIYAASKDHFYMYLREQWQLSRASILWCMVGVSLIVSTGTLFFVSGLLPLLWYVVAGVLFLPLWVCMVYSPMLFWAKARAVAGRR